MAEFGELITIATKLLQKTREGKISWEPSFASINGAFRCGLGDSFEFVISQSQSASLFFNMLDNSGNSILSGESTPLPTSPEEETFSETLEKLYELARRQALRVDEKVRVASELLDRT